MAASDDDVGPKLLGKVKKHLQETQDPAWFKLAEVIRERESMRDFTNHEDHRVDPDLVLESTVQKLLEKDEWRRGRETLRRETLSEEGNETGPDFLAFKAFVRETQSLVELVSHVMEVCNNVLALCKAAFIPEELHFDETSSKLEIYVFFKFDHEGRPIYRLKNPPATSTDMEEPMLAHRGQEVRWNRDHWEVGNEARKWELASVLVTDPGVWRPTGTQNRGRKMHVRAGGKRLLSEVQVRELREIVFRGGAGGEDKAKPPQVAKVVEKTCEKLAGVFQQDVKLVQYANRLLDSLEKIARKLDLKKENGQYVMEVVGPSDSAAVLQEKLIRLSSLSNNMVLKRLKDTLPKYKEKKQYGLINECMTLNCRLLDLSDMRNVEESFLPRLLHRFCLFHWQQEHPGQTMYLDLGTGEPELKEEKDLPTKAKAVRCVTVSDTHGWDADIELALALVLFHGGDVAFEGSPAAKGAPVPGDFKAQMSLFNTPRYRKYQWIFMVPGNHDQPLFDMWSNEPDKLFQLMPDNLVLLQAYMDFPSSKLRSSGAAKSMENRECVEDGAVWLYPKELGPDGVIKLILRRPSDKREGDRGWIIAGSGVSLTHNDWSPNRAFQLPPKDEAGRTKEAARCLLKHNPDIVLSHGPPQAREGDRTERWDEGRGDEELRNALDESNSWKVTLFGHSHENHGVVHRRPDGRLFVNAAISTQMYVPARPPIVFDLLVNEDLEKEEMGQGGRGDRASWCARCCDCTQWLSGSPEPDQGELVAQWVPTEFIAPRVLEILADEKKEAAQAVRRRLEDGRCESDQVEAAYESWEAQVEAEERKAIDKTRLSEFHVCGPAVQWGFQTICSWFFAPALTVLAYFVTGKPWGFAYWPFQSAPAPECVEERSTWREGCDAFVEYPLGLWGLFLLPCAHTLWVQRKCLTYVILGQVHELGRGFTLAGTKVSFYYWLYMAHLCTCIGVTDITTQSLFLVQVVKSVQINRQIDTVWKETIHQSWMVGGIPWFDNIRVLFAACLGMTFLQAVYIVLHLFPTHNEGVSYECKSMRDGYTTWASSLFRFEVDYQVDNAQDASRCNTTSRRKYWHADILRILAYYGRMPALVWAEAATMFARVERQKKSREFVRYLQILFHRQQEFLVRLILLDILEKGLKLEIQISVFAIDMALQRDQTSLTGVMNKQMFFAIVVGFLSLLYAIYTHKQMLNFLWSVTDEIEDVHWQNKDEGKQNLQRFQTWRLCYTFIFSLLALIVLHCFVKFIMAFTCPYSLSNNFLQCAHFHDNGTRDNRSLIFGNMTTS